jgi:hypothetical protein
MKVTSTYDKLHGAESFLSQGNSQNFVVPVCSLACPQERASDACLELDKSSTRSSEFFKVHLILAAHLYVCLRSDPFSSRIATEILYAFLFSPLHVTCASIPLCLIWCQKEQILKLILFLKLGITWKSFNYEGNLRRLSIRNYFK